MEREEPSRKAFIGMLVKLLMNHNGNLSLAAKEIGISRDSLIRILEDHHIDPYKYMKLMFTGKL